MNKNCKNCNCLLTIDNAAKKNAKYFRNICKPCRSKEVISYNVGNEKRKVYVRSYLRKIGKVRQYPCEYCNKLCYKKYAKAFCSDICRFMSYVSIFDECWLWKGSKNRSGYGKFCFKGNVSAMAHRVSYQLFNGDIKEGLAVCHTCDDPSCVKPAHLWLGTTQENTKDMIRKNRSLFGEKHNKCKLSNDDILKIREIYKKKKLTQNKIAEIYNITSGHVNNIVKRRVWSHV